MHRKSDVDCPGLNPGLNFEKLAYKSLNHCMTFLDLATGASIADTVVKFGMNIYPLETFFLAILQLHVFRATSMAAA
jgi:hypothetical protein